MQATFRLPRTVFSPLEERKSSRAFLAGQAFNSVDQRAVAGGDMAQIDKGANLGWELFETKSSSLRHPGLDA